jgi:hypothetical protein
VVILLAVAVSTKMGWMPPYCDERSCCLNFAEEARTRYVGAVLRWDQGTKQWSIPFVSLGVEDGKVVVELPTRPRPPVLF